MVKKRNSVRVFLSKLIILLTFVFFMSNFSNAQSCVAKIEFESVTTTLSGCAPFNVIFSDKNSSTRQWNFSDSTFSPATSNAPKVQKEFPGGLKDTTYRVVLKKTCGASDTVYVTVFVKPKVDFKVDTTSACAIVDKIQFTNLLDKGKYIWKFGDSDPTGTTLENPLKKYSSGAVYDVSLTVTNDKNCQTELIKKNYITINSKPNPQFYLDLFEGCVPFTAQVTNDTDTNFVKIDDWKWMLGKEVIHSDYSLKSIRIDKPFLGDLVLVATSNLGCRDTFNTQLHAITTPNASFLVSKSEICSSDSIKVTNSALLSDKAIFNWSFDGGVSTLTKDVKGPHTINWQNGGIKKIELTITDSTCTATTSNLITIFDSPKVDLTTSKDTICLGDIVKFKATPSSLLSYRFFKNETLYRNGVEDEFSTDTLANGDQFYVIAKDAQGCDSRKSSVKKLSVREKPKVSLLSSDVDNVVCKGDSVVFTGVPSGYSNYTFYSFSKAMQSGVSNVFKAKDLQNSDSVFVEALSDNGCSKTSSNAFVMSVVKELPAPKINCGKSTNNQVTFIWDTIRGAQSYKVSVNGGAFNSVGATNSLVQSIPLSGDSIKISVKAIGNFECGNSLPSKDKYCQAIFCTPIVLNHTPELEVCKGELAVLKLNGIKTSNYSLHWEDNEVRTKDSVYTTLLSNSKDITVEFIDSIQKECPKQEFVYRVKVNSIPNVELTSSVPTVICEGTEGVFTAKPSGYETYTFYNGNEIIQNDWRNTCKIANFKNGIPFRVVASKYGCSAVSNELINTVVEPLSQPIVYCGASSTSAMEFVWDQVQGAVAYQVSVNGGNWIAPSSGVKHVLTGLKPGSSAYITVKAIGVTICGSSEVSLQTSCFTNPCTAITYNFAHKASLCKGESSLFKVTGVSIPNYLVSWNGLKYDKSLSYSAKPTKDTIVRVIIKNANEPSCPSELKYAQVKVVEQPNVSLTVYPTFFCEGDEVKFLATPSKYENYKFFNQASLIYTGYKNEFSASNLKNGASIRVIARNGNCIDTSNSIVLTVSKPLDQPVVNSGKITNNSIEFVWDSIPNATGYMISVDGAPYSVPSTGVTGLSHQVNGLTENTKKIVKIIAIGIGSCGNSPESDTIIRYTTGHVDSVCTKMNFVKSSDVSICEDNQVNLSISEISIQQPIISWKNDLSLNQTTFSFQALFTDTIKVAIRNAKEPLCPEFRKFIKVKVNPKPVITLGDNLFNDSICEGDEVSFFINPNTTLNYTFYNDTKLIQSSNSNTLLIPHVASDLLIRGVAKDEIGCFSDTSYLDVKMVDKPIVSLIDNSVNSGICKDKSLELSLAPISSLNKLYEFFQDGILIQSGSSNKFKLNSLLSNTTFKARAIHRFGCKGDFTKEKQFVPFQLPEISISTSDLDNQLCERETFTINVTPSNLAHYIFIEGEDTLSKSANYQFTLSNLSKTRAVKVIAIDSNTCISNFNDTVKIIVHPLPKMLNESSHTMCSDDSLKIALTTDIPSTISWKAFDNSKLVGEDVTLKSGIQIRNKLVSSSLVEENTVYTISPKSLFGCVGDTQKLNVFVRPIPRATNLVDSVCSGTIYSFNAANFPINLIPSNTTYKWGIPTNPSGNLLTGYTNENLGELLFSQTITNSSNVLRSLEYIITPISGEIGSCIGNDFKLTLVVNPVPSIANRIVDSICSGQLFNFKPVNGEPTSTTIVPLGTKFRWEFKEITGPLRGANDQAMLQNSVNTRLFTDSISASTLKLLVTPISNTCIGNNFEVPLLIKPLPHVTNLLSFDICSESRLGISLNSTVNSEFSWSTQDAPLIQGESKVNQTSSIINDSLISLVNTATTINYVVVPTSLEGCVGPEEFVSVKINPLPIITISTSDIDKNICDGTDFEVSVTPNDLTSYIFYSGKDTLQDSLYNRLLFKGLNKDTLLNVRAKDRNGCYSKISDTIKIFSHPIPAMSSGNAYKICSDDSLKISLSSTYPSSFYWKALSDRPNVEGEHLSWIVNDSINQVFHNSSSKNDTLLYEVVPVSLMGCVGDTQKITIEIHPTPVIANKLDSICSGVLFAINPKNSIPNTLEIVPSETKYTWETPKVAIADAIKGAFEQIIPADSISQRLTNVTNASVVVTYKVIPISGEIGKCVGAPFSVNITSLPVPVIPNQLEDTVCSNISYLKEFKNAVPTNATIVPNGTRFTWTEPVVVPNGSVLGGVPSTKEEKEFKQQFINKTNDFGKVNYLLTPRTDYCLGNSFILSLAVAPEPLVNSVKSLSICSEDQLGVNLTASIPSEFQWIGLKNSNLTGVSESKMSTSFINDKIQNTSNKEQILKYTITPISEKGCYGQPDTLSISVSPRPTIAAISLDVCSEDSIKIIPNGAIASNTIPLSTKYTWEMPTVSDPTKILGATKQIVPSNGILQKLSTIDFSGSVVYVVTPFSEETKKCIGKSFEVSVNLYPIPNPTISSEIKGVCNGEKATITTNLDEKNYPNTTFTWSTGQISKNIEVQPSTKTTYSLIAESNKCRSLPDSITIFVDKLVPIANAGSDVTICRGDSVKLTASGGKSYVWELSEGLSNSTNNASISAAPYTSTTYKVAVFNDYCVSNAEVKVIIDRCLKELPKPIPQIITPNGDVANEFWNIDDVDYFTKSTLIIFNRWGTVVYQEAPYLNQWKGQNENGDDLPDGTYYYSLDLGNGKPPYKGYIVITR
jgi:gliding motility-associated-like protein